MAKHAKARPHMQAPALVAPLSIQTASALPNAVQGDQVPKPASSICYAVVSMQPTMRHTTGTWVLSHSPNSTKLEAMLSESKQTFPPATVTKCPYSTKPNIQ